MAVSCRIEHVEAAAATIDVDEGGKSTPSIMCTTPLLAKLSALTTFLRSLDSKLGPTRTRPPHFVTCSGLPSTVLTAWNAFKSVDNTCSGRTWYVKMSTNSFLFSGFINFDSVPAGSAAKASLVGAKTVNGPGELKVSAKSPATTAATRVDKSLTDSASLTMFGLTGGMRTPSIMCTTPLLAKLSAAVTSFPPTRTRPADFVTCRSLPSTVLTAWDAFRSVESTFSGRTWYVKMSTNSF